MRLFGAFSVQRPAHSRRQRSNVVGERITANNHPKGQAAANAIELRRVFMVRRLRRSHSLKPILSLRSLRFHNVRITFRTHSLKSMQAFGYLGCILFLFNAIRDRPSNKTGRPSRQDSGDRTKSCLRMPGLRSRGSLSTRNGSEPRSRICP
jgi:hypothetical protein